jgi:uncharacterized membrane-anchored protein YhcB (DUF1043 family)/signal recognition particle receptor subunit beta
MTTTTSTDSAALTVVDRARSACSAFGREDLLARLETTRTALAVGAAHVVIVGEFKQGKSSLVNALVAATICPVDDDIATAVPTFLREAPAPRAEVVYVDDLNPDIPTAELVGESVDLADLHRYVTEHRSVQEGLDRTVSAVNIWLPRRILDGMTLVDTPGVGGLGSSHNTPTMGALPLADAVVFVTDASQEFTRAEIDFLHRAHDACDNLVVALTKTDLYPQWRKIRDLDEGHLQRAGLSVEILPVSAPLRIRAVQGDDRDLNQTSGYPALVRFLAHRVVRESERNAERNAGLEVSAVCDQLTSQFSSERSALSDPDRARAIVDDLTETKARTEALRSQAARWNQTLGDGIADLVADVDHDYRGRTRTLLKECDMAIDNSDPADTWTEFEPWLAERVSREVLENYRFLQDSAATLSALVGEHFQDASGEVLEKLAIHNPIPVMGSTTIDATVDTEKASAAARGFTVLRGSYMGVLMFTMIGSMVGIALGPVAIGIGVLMGRKTLREEKQRQIANRRIQAKNAVRKYTDEVTFHVNKDSRDTLRRVQRQLRDHYSARAEELHRSTTEALKAANLAAKQLESERTKRVADIDAELKRIGSLHDMARKLVAEGSP